MSAVCALWGPENWKDTIPMISPMTTVVKRVWGGCGHTLPMKYVLMTTEIVRYLVVLRSSSGTNSQDFNYMNVVCFHFILFGRLRVRPCLH